MTSATRVQVSTPFWKQMLQWQLPVLDRQYLWLFTALTVLGWIMVTSASMDWADAKMHNPFAISIRHGIYLLLALVVAWFTLHFPLKMWQQISSVLLGVSFIGLVLVLIPGIGREVNGSIRWISLGFINFQPSELAKVATVIYMAGYLERRKDEVQSSWMGFFKPLLVLSVLAVLLLLEPDYGAVVVIMATAMAMLFLGGVKKGQYIVTVVGMSLASVLLVVTQEYRMKRFTGYLNPWSDENVFGSGYQLTQSLIAFGRGEWLGAGLGNSMQKLFYLPEAHTDFVFAIWSEETGLLGSLTIIGLFAWLFIKSMRLGQQALNKQYFFAAYAAFGLALTITFQAFINLGVNMGLLPTKGLTLPFISYGGSSLMACAFAAALLLRIHAEVNGDKQHD